MLAQLNAPMLLSHVTGPVTKTFFSFWKLEYFLRCVTVDSGVPSGILRFAMHPPGR